jgi:hypothetical protein
LWYTSQSILLTKKHNKLTDSTEVQKAALIAELQQAGIKHTPEKILRIAKLDNGKIVFLEEGKGGEGGRGLAHILENHQEDFMERGIGATQIIDAVMAAVTQGQIIGYQKTRSPTPRTIYEVFFDGNIQYISVTVGDNGYIVGANPAHRP